MSATNQTSNKKSGSSNTSMVNTPASTPVTTMANGQTTTQTTPPPNNNAPKYGTLVPNRIFVGGISANTTEAELLQLFSNYGTVKAAKIIQDRAGVSKGYGFITFESEDDAKRLQREADNIVLRERKLNIAPAIKKQPFSRAFDASSPPAVAPGNPAQYFFPPSAMPYFQGGVAYYPQPPTGPADPTTQQPTVYQPPSVYSPQSAQPQTAAYPPVMFPAQPIYMPQQYPMPMPYDYNYYANGGAQYMVGSQGGPQSQGPPMQRPNSPPRPPCYSQQLPYANPPDAMYYNMPIYGPVDGPMYADPTTLDLSMPNGALAEELSVQDTPTNPATSTHFSTSTSETQPTASQSDNIQNASINPEPDITSRKSNTPVVSLLSLDQHQEKDISSMQSGRRKKLTLGVPNQQYAQPNGFTSYGYNYTTPGFGGYAPPPQPVQGFGSGYSFSNGWKRRGTGDRRNTETSSMSSLRTDSNSSASVVDENRNEEKVSVIDSSNTPPPPAPYSPIVNYNRSYYNSHNFPNTSLRPVRGSCDRRYSMGNANPKLNTTNSFNYRDFNTTVGNRTQDGSSSKNAHQTLPSYTITKLPHSPVSQMHPGNQHFVPPTRRNRRTVRRNGSSSLSEIGAGDAPLPSQDVSEACNKLDSLKL